MADSHKELEVVVQDEHIPPFPTSSDPSVQQLFDLEQAFNSIGKSMFTKEHGWRCLAYCAEVNDENVVLNKQLRAAIQIAQWKARIVGGYVPLWEHVQGIKRCREELMSGACPWLKSFLTRYNIKFNAIEAFMVRKPLY